MSVIKHIALKKLCLIFLFLSPLLSKAQELRDTVTMYIDNRIELIIATSHYSFLKHQDEAVKIIQSFESYLPEVEQQLKSDRADLVTYVFNEQITVEEDVQKDVFLLTDGEIKYTGFRDKALLKSDSYHIMITANDLSKIKEVSMIDCLQKVIEQLPRNRNLSNTLYFQCIGNEVSTIPDKGVLDGKTDALEIGFGAGAGLIKNQWVGDLAMKLRVSFGRKNYIRHSPYVSFNLYYDFPNSRRTNINTFMNIGYSSFNTKGDKDRSEIGFEVGYLLSRQGELFDKNTSRISLNWSPVNSVIVSPQLYISEGFKQAYPGVRIGFGL